MSLWDTIKSATTSLGQAAGTQTQKTKLKAEMMLVDRDINGRLQQFGVQLYEYVEPLTKENPNFFAADDMLTTTLRPALIETQREIAALDIKHRKQKDKISLAKANRSAAFPTPAANWQEKVTNFGKSTIMAGGEMKLSTELSFIEGDIRHYKQTFGVKLYPILEHLEDNKGWLPTDREIRSIYDNCRRDVEKFRKKKQLKQEQWEEIHELSERGNSSGHRTTPGVLVSSLPQPPPSPMYGGQQQQQQQQQQQSSQFPSVTATPAHSPWYNNNSKNDDGVIAASGASSSTSIPPTIVEDSSGYHYPTAPSTSAASPYPPPQPQQPHDPFAGTAPPPSSSSIVNNDPFNPQTAENQQQVNTNWMNQANPFAPASTTTTATAASSYDDPFASIATPQPQQQTTGNTNDMLWR